MIGVGVRTLDDVIVRRYSCRSFLEDPVPMDTIRAVLTLAQRTPSWCNTQPWQVHLVMGDAVPRFSGALVEQATTRGERADLVTPEEYVGVYKARRREAGITLYRSLGIERDDVAGRVAQANRNLTFFGAPHVAVITTDRGHGAYGTVDCGGYVSTLLLALESRGVGAIPQAAIALYSDAVRSFLDLPDDRLVVCAVAFGFADDGHPANGFRTARAELTEVLHVVDH
ncbi:nitroreductase [Actinomadura madurae]|uniref:nitroreductase n=1 Tax=Actinomadura madurae TaxID=1993 RepID=UPI00399B2C3D